MPWGWSATGCPRTLSDTYSVAEHTGTVQDGRVFNNAARRLELHKLDRHLETISRQRGLDNDRVSRQVRMDRPELWRQRCAAAVGRRMELARHHGLPSRSEKQVWELDRKGLRAYSTSTPKRKTSVECHPAATRVRKYVRTTRVPPECHPSATRAPPGCPRLLAIVVVVVVGAFSARCSLGASPCSCGASP